MGVQVSARRPLVLAARGAVLLVMAVGSVGYSLADKTVTISVDGSTRTVHTFAGDVSSALRRAGVNVGGHDVVVPTLSRALHDGSHIVVARARPLLLSVNGVPRTVWVTQADASAELGLDLAGAYVISSRSSLLVRLPQHVTLTVGGVASNVTTTAATVADLLAAQGIQLGPFDVVSTPLSAYPLSGTAVRVARVTRTQSLQRTAIAMPTVRVPDAKLAAGRAKLAHDGRAGIEYRLWGVVRRDGTIIETKLLTTTIVAAKAKVIRYGTRPVRVEAAALARSTKAKSVAVTKSRAGTKSPVVTRSPASSSTTATRSAPVVRPKAVPVVHRAAPKKHLLNWAALARCESGGNPRLVDGGYYGLYQFSLGTWQAVGGKGKPSDASAAEQTHRAQLLYAEQGRSPWPACGHYL